MQSPAGGFALVCLDSVCLEAPPCRGKPAVPTYCRYLFGAGYVLQATCVAVVEVRWDMHPAVSKASLQKAIRPTTHTANPNHDQGTPVGPECNPTLLWGKCSLCTGPITQSHRPWLRCDRLEPRRDFTHSKALSVCRSLASISGSSELRELLGCTIVFCGEADVWHLHSSN